MKIQSKNFLAIACLCIIWAITAPAPTGHAQLQSEPTWLLMAFSHREIAKPAVSNGFCNAIWDYQRGDLPRDTDFDAEAFALLNMDYRSIQNTNIDACALAQSIQKARPGRGQGTFSSALLDKYRTYFAGNPEAHIGRRHGYMAKDSWLRNVAQIERKPQAGGE